MTIEEKAKAYDEAIKIAKETYNTQPMYRNWLESMFPELQENEIKDMREKLIKAFGSIGKKEWGGVNVKDVIHWLEKQGESYTKRDVDDAYLKGISDAKNEHEKQGEQKPWSEKDEKEYKYVLKFVDNILNNCGNKKDYEHSKRCYDWLKSLKQRYTWKPNLAQLNALSIVSKGNAPDDIEAIVSLYNDLKKL